MSSVVISGDTSGAITLAAPAVAGTNTVTLAAQTGTLNAAGPAFRASLSSQQTGVTSATNTKIQFSTEDFDTNSNYDPTTNYRFTPTVAGYYQVNAMVAISGTGLSGAFCSIYKNGSFYLMSNYASSAIGTSYATVSGIVYMNGTTDYVEAYGRGTVTSGTVTFDTTVSTGTCFSACLMRGA